MRRGVALYLVGSTALLALAGCGRSWLSSEEREPWRREAEVACVKSGVIKPGPTVTPIRSIEGPGVCGADYPFKVAALGEAGVLGFVDDLRPPASIPQILRNLPAYSPRPAAAGSSSFSHAPQDAYGLDGAQGGHVGAPLSLHPPGVPHDEETAAEAAEGDPYAVSGGADTHAPSPRGASPGRSYPAAPGTLPAMDEPPLPALGPQRGPAPSVPSFAAVKPAATLACPVISALDQWVARAVQPAAQRWFGQQVAEITQISAYSCRGMNGQRGAPISEHAFGNALDIAAFTLADGRRITVKGGWRGQPEEQGFLRDVQAAACEQFSTVLAPGSNVYHYDHIHVDLRRRRSGKGICKPAAVSGELVAQRAREYRLSGHRSGRLGFGPEEKADLDFGITLPRAIPGAD